MPEYLSDEDLERIVEFANTPEYRRSPDLLVPGTDE